MNWLDLVIVLLAIIFLVIGLKRGFMTSILSHFSFGLNCLLSFFLCRPFAFIYEKCGLGRVIASSYSTRFLAASGDFGVNLLEVSKDSLNSFVGGAINNSGVSGLGKFLFRVFLNKSTLYSDLHESGVSSRTLAEIFSETYSKFFISIISFVTSLVFLFILVLLFRLLVKKLRQIGFVKVVDNVLGVFYGLLRCLIILIVLSFIIKLISPISFMAPVTDYINGSFIGRLVYGQISTFMDNYLNFGDIVRSIFGGG